MSDNNSSTSPKQIPTSSEKSSPSQPSNQNPPNQDPNTTTPTADSDLTAEPEEITHSDAHESFAIVVPKERLPLPEELEQNGKPTSKGGPQEVQRSLEEMSVDFRRKYGVHGSGVKPKKEDDGKGKKDGGDGKGGGGGVKREATGAETRVPSELKIFQQDPRGLGFRERLSHLGDLVKFKPCETNIIEQSASPTRPQQRRH